jgi:hypothetical protein
MSRAVCALAVSCLALVVASSGAVAPREAESLLEYARRSQVRYAYGVYIKKVKVGWSVEETKLGKHNGKDVLISTSQNYFSVNVSGEKSVTSETTVVYYSLEGNGPIVFAEKKSREDKKETTRRAVPKGKGLLLSTKQGARSSERMIPIPKDMLGDHRKLETWLRTAKKGDKFEKYTAEWDGDDIDVKETYTFQEKTAVVWGGAQVPVYKTQLLTQGARFQAQLLADGTPFMAVVGGLLTLKMEKEAIAKKLDGGEIDLMAASSIVIDRDIGPARRVEKLTLELTGLDDFELPQSHRQRTRPAKNKKVVLELQRDFRVPKGTALTKAQRTEHTKATPKIQCEHEAIRNKALAIVGKEKDPVKMATLLARWVYRKVRKSYAANADNALAVLDNLAGDCTEHTLLFVALARAVGLPAREVGGLAYVNSGGKPMFGWHAWAEIHDGAQWVTIDPTWDQIYVDGTHIKFSEGSEDMAWVNVAGHLRIKVVKVEKK